MKKLIAGVMALALLASCGNKKTGIDPFASLTNEVDSALHRRRRAEIRLSRLHKTRRF